MVKEAVPGWVYSLISEEVDRTHGSHASDVLQKLYVEIRKRDAEDASPTYADHADVRCCKCGGKVGDVDLQWSEHQLECGVR